MMKFTIALVATVVVAAVAGCDHSNANYCAGKLNDDCRSDGGTQITGCVETPSKCTGNTTVCDTANDVCVECTTENAAACVNLEPVCGADNSCRGCTAHSECASDVCLPDGSCALASDVAYVDGAGTDGTGSMCDKGAPCKTVTMAVGTPKAIIKVSGSVDDKISIGRSVKIFAADNAKLSSTSNGTLLTTMGSAVVEVYDLTIADASGPGLGNGVQVGAGTTFKFVGGQITGCREAGIATNGGTVVVTGATVSGNSGGGFQLFGNGAYKFVNNFIAGNGSGTSAVGGIQIANVTQAGIFEFAFNTIYNNDVIPTAIAGISCQTVGVPLSFKNNIVYANKVSSGGTQVGGSSMCQHTYSDIGPDTASGIGNINADPQFVNVAQLNIHIQATSPAKDAADPAATITTDIDNDVRPQGPGRDIGADEYKP